MTVHIVVGQFENEDFTRSTVPPFFLNMVGLAQGIGTPCTLEVEVVNPDGEGISTTIVCTPDVVGRLQALIDSVRSANENNGAPA